MTEFQQRAAETNSTRIYRLRRAAACLELCPYVRSVLCRLEPTTCFAKVVRALGSLENLFSLYLTVRGFGEARNLILNWVNAYMPEGKEATVESLGRDPEVTEAARVAGIRVLANWVSSLATGVEKENREGRTELTPRDYRYRVIQSSQMQLFVTYDAGSEDILERRGKRLKDLFHLYLVTDSFERELDLKLAQLDQWTRDYTCSRWDTVPENLMHRMPPEVIAKLPSPEETLRLVPDLVSGMEVVSYLLEKPWDPCSLIIDAYDMQRLWTLRQQDALIVLKEQLFASLAFTRIECIVREVCEGLRQSEREQSHKSHALGWLIIEDLLQLGCCHEVDEQYRMLLNRIMRRLLLLYSLNYGDNKSSEWKRRISADPELISAWAHGYLHSVRGECNVYD